MINYAHVLLRLARIKIDQTSLTVARTVKMGWAAIMALTGDHSFRTTGIRGVPTAGSTELALA